VPAAQSLENCELPPRSQRRRLNTTLPRTASPVDILLGETPMPPMVRVCGGHVTVAISAKALNSGKPWWEPVRPLSFCSTRPVCETSPANTVDTYATQDTVASNEVRTGFRCRSPRNVFINEPGETDSSGTTNGGVYQPQKG
jgi:hypothetical protein